MRQGPEHPTQNHLRRDPNGDLTGHQGLGLLYGLALHGRPFLPLKASLRRLFAAGLCNKNLSVMQAPIFFNAHGSNALNIVPHPTVIAASTIAETSTIGDKSSENTTVLEEIELGLLTVFEDTSALEHKKSLAVFSAIAVVCIIVYLK